MKKSKIKTRIICLIACLTMLIGSTFTVSAAGDLPAWTRAYDGAVFHVTSTTPAGNYIYGYWPQYTPRQQAILFAAIDAAGVNNGMSQYEKCVAINNYICSVFDYRIWLTDEEIAQINADDAGLEEAWMKEDGLRTLEKIIDGKPAYIACSAYADLFQNMTEAVGISCMFLCNNGLVSIDKNHVWNTVYADGKWYQIDVTYNDQATEGTSNRYLMSENGWNDGLHMINAMDGDRIACMFQASFRVTEKGIPEPDPDSEKGTMFKELMNQYSMEKYGRPYTGKTLSRISYLNAWLTIDEYEAVVEYMDTGTCLWDARPEYSYLKGVIDEAVFRRR